MATQTTYYEFNKPSGTDLVNPLVDNNPNWDAADAALHELNERSFANATEVVSLGVHAISRINQYTKFIKWIATANYTAGETFTVDGNVVAASTPSGASLATGAYVTGAVVIACLNADDSAMTVFVSGTNVATDSERLGGELPAYYAIQSDMTSAEIDIGNIKDLNGNTSIASIADGTLTGAVSAINTSLSELKNITTSETKIGKFNGVDLYRRVYTADNVSLSGTTVIDSAFTNANVKLITKLQVTTFDGSDWESNLDAFISPNTYRARVSVRSSGVNLLISQTTVTKYVIVIEYTKP